MLEIKLITIKNSKIIETVVGRCNLKDYHKRLYQLAKIHFSNEWEYRKETPDAIAGYLAEIQTGNVLSI